MRHIVRLVATKARYMSFLGSSPKLREGNGVVDLNDDLIEMIPEIK